MTAMARPAIYLDYQTTTPTDERVVDAMMPFFRERFGNPHSVSHGFGHDAEQAVEVARAQVAALIGAEAREIVFTSGATEANNLAIKGALRFHRRRGRDHVVTVATEHKCVLESCRAMEAEGFHATYLPVGRDGRVDPAAVTAAVDERTAVVSVMAANNEIGVLQPLAEIGALCRERGALFHTDAAQAFGKVPLDVHAMNVDLLSISGHKAYGPKGIGALYVRRRPRARIEAQISGGGQERGMRSGTLPTPLCFGLGAAAAIAAEEMAAEAARLGDLRDRLLAGLEAGIPGLTVNGSREWRLPANLNVNFPGVAADELMRAAPDLALSTGSACSSASLEPSYVLRALGVPDEAARGSIRFGLGRYTTRDEIDRAVDILVAAYRALRNRPAAAAGTEPKSALSGSR